MEKENVQSGSTFLRNGKKDETPPQEVARKTSKKGELVDLGSLTGDW